MDGVHTCRRVDERRCGFDREGDEKNGRFANDSNEKNRQPDGADEMRKAVGRGIREKRQNDGACHDGVFAESRDKRDKRDGDEGERQQPLFFAEVRRFFL